MDEYQFFAQLRPFNIKYREIFGYIPNISDYSCNRDEYLEALKKSIENKVEISEYILQYSSPIENGVEI